MSNLTHFVFSLFPGAHEDDNVFIKLESFNLIYSTMLMKPIVYMKLFPLLKIHSESQTLFPLLKIHSRS